MTKLQYVKALREKRIKCSTKAEKFLIGHLLAEAGETVSFPKVSVAGMDIEYPIVKWFGGRWDGSSNSMDGTDMIDANSVIDGLTRTFKAVVLDIQLTKDYSAKFSTERPDVVEVGCQTIHVDVLRDLLKQIDKTLA